MIIRRLQAENILRFKQLDLNGLPARGRILIAGPNESGKSVILETIALALFGRTSNLPCELVTKAVKWGADNASVTLDFIGRDNMAYSVFRYFDSDAVQRARLTRQDQETPVAQGVETVNQALIEVIGFDFQQFINALYLTHGRHSHPRPGETVKELAGVAALERVGTELANEINVRQEAIDARIQRLAQTHEQIHALNLCEETLGQLEDQLSAERRQVSATTSTIERWIGFDAALVHAAKSIETAANRVENTSPDTGLASWLSRSDQLDAGLKELESICLGGHVEMESSPAAVLRQWHAQLQGRLNGMQQIQETVNAELQALLQWLGEITAPPDTLTCAIENSRLETTLWQLQRGRRRQGWGAILFLLLSVVLGAGLWVVLEPQKSGAFAPLVLDLLARYVPLWTTSQTIFLMPAAILASLLTLWNLGGRWRKKGKIKATQLAKSQLAARIQHARGMVASINDALTQSLSGQAEILAQMPSTPWASELNAWMQEEGRPFMEANGLRQYLSGVGKRVQAFQTEVGQCREEAQEQLLASQEELKTQQASVASLEQEIKNEKARRQENLRLRQTIVVLEEENRQDEHAIGVRRIGRELLKGACLGLSTHFNQELHRFSANTAPLFTQGRYRHLRLDEELNVMVFSEAKNDFVQMEEISTGVRRQLTLAVRMALAQALAIRAGGNHFIALDEPFAYFDRQRCRETLDALLRISDKITQIWIVGQEFDTEASAKGLYIQCTMEQDALVMTTR